MCTRWKLDSLEVMACGDLADTEIKLHTEVNKQCTPFKNVNEMKFRGSFITNKATTSEAMNHRLAQTEKAYWDILEDYGEKRLKTKQSYKRGQPSSTAPPPSHPDGGAWIYQHYGKHTDGEYTT